MLTPPKRHEIDHRTIKLVVGVIAIAIAPLTSVFASTRLESISASYYEGGWSQSIFIGFLFAIAAMLLAYNGYSKTEMILSKVAAGAGLGVALFPCKCDTHAERVPYAHAIFAAVMFLILAYFCVLFRRRAKAKAHAQANWRAMIYTACGVAIILAIVVLGVNAFANDAIRQVVPQVTLYGETVGLVAFGVAWLTASRVLPFITSADERFSPFRAHNPA